MTAVYRAICVEEAVTKEVAHRLRKRSDLSIVVEQMSRKNSFESVGEIAKLADRRDFTCTINVPHPQIA